MIIIQLLIVIALVFVATLVAARLGLFTGKPPIALGVRDGKLSQPRAGYPNSVLSQHNSTDYHSIAPLRYTGSPSEAMTRLRNIVNVIPDTSIIESSELYLYAQCTTALMRFVDDVEFLIDPNVQLIHVRSASRLGRKDFGVNRDRIETIRRLFEK